MLGRKVCEWHAASARGGGKPRYSSQPLVPTDKVDGERLVGESAHLADGFP